MWPTRAATLGMVFLALLLGVLDSFTNLTAAQQQQRDTWIWYGLTVSVGLVFLIVGAHPCTACWAQRWQQWLTTGVWAVMGVALIQSLILVGPVLGVLIVLLLLSCTAQSPRPAVWLCRIIERSAFALVRAGQFGRCWELQFWLSGCGGHHHGLGGAVLL